MHISADVNMEQIAADLGAVVREIRGAGLDSPLDAVAELDLPFSQARTLLALDRLGGVASVGKLAERLPLSQGATSRVVEGLARGGLVERQEDPADRRVKRVRITPAGSETVARFDEFREAKSAALRGLVGGLDPEDQILLGKLLRRMLERAGVEGEAPR